MSTSFEQIAERFQAKMGENDWLCDRIDHGGHDSAICVGCITVALEAAGVAALLDVAKEAQRVTTLCVDREENGNGRTCWENWPESPDQWCDVCHLTASLAKLDGVIGSANPQVCAEEEL